MSDPAAPESPPELILLDALIDTCRQTCRHNPDLAIRRLALERETKLQREKERIVAGLAKTEEEAA